MDIDFKYHYRFKNGENRSVSMPDGYTQELANSSMVTMRRVYPNGDEVIQVISKDYVDLFSTFELEVTPLQI